VTDREALYQAVLASPADDLPRLVFADWLEEQGEGDYAAFIRVQCELARVPEYDVAWAKARLDGDRWIRGVPFRHLLPELPTGLLWAANRPFRRGFPAVLRCSNPMHIVTHVDSLFRMAPIDSLIVSYLDPGSNDSLLELFTDPHFARINTIRLVNTEFNEYLISAMDHSPYTSNLRHLSFDLGSIRALGLRDLVRSTLFPQVQSLHFRGDRDLPMTLGIGEIVEMLRRANSSGLETLEVEIDEGWLPMAELAHSPVGESLKELWIGGHPPLVDFAVAFADPDAFTNLRGVFWELHGHPIRDVVLPMPGVPRWQALSLHGLKLDTPVHEFILGAAEGLAHLRYLDLAEMPIGDTGAVMLAASSHLMNLHELRLTNCDIRSGALAFANSPYTKNLARLDLRGNILSTTVNMALRDRFGDRVQLSES